MTPVVQLSAIHVLGLSALGVAAGQWARRRASLLERLNVPAAVIGGLLYAVIIAALRDRFVDFQMDLALRDLLMIAFFTTIGMSASLKLLRGGGAQVLALLLLASAGCVIQNVVGIGVARLVGVDDLLGIVAGAVSLGGGPATALAFGADFEKRFAVEGAVVVGIASAMFGIVTAGLISGAVSGAIIERRRLTGGGQTSASLVAADGGDALSWMRTALAVAVAMGAGSLIGAAFERMGIVLPVYIGAMIAAAVLRNVDDLTGWFDLSQMQMNVLGGIALNLFLVMALLTLRLWELVNLAGPMLAILLAQVPVTVAMALGVYRLLGRDYESAVTAGGFMGFMLGTTANAMACLEVLSARYGPAPRAFLVVPVVGAFLLDFTNALIITAMANMLR